MGFYIYSWVILVKDHTSIIGGSDFGHAADCTCTCKEARLIDKYLMEEIVQLPSGLLRSGI